MESAAVSRLVQMQARFQQKQIAEREQKMVALLEERQARALGRVRASPNQVTSQLTQGKVRQMFEERRHQQQQQLNSVGGTGTRAGAVVDRSGTRAGVDRGHPLRPIRHVKKIILQKSENDSYKKIQDVNHNSVHEHNIILERFDNIHLKDTDELDNLTNIEDETFPESLCASPAIRLVPPVLAPSPKSPNPPSRAKPVPPVRKSRASPPKVTRKSSPKTINNGNRGIDDDVTLPRDQNRNREMLQERSRNMEINNENKIKELGKDLSEARVKQELSDDEIRDRKEDDLILDRYLEQEEKLHKKHDRSKENDIAKESVDQKAEESSFNHGQNGKNDKPKEIVWETEEVISRAARNQAPRASPVRTINSPVNKLAPSTRSRPQAAAARASPPKSSGKNAMSTPRQTNKPAASPACVACGVCGRTFAPDRVERHQKICQKNSTKKRKPYDILKHRVAGTEAEPFLRQLRKQQTVPKTASAGRGGRAGSGGQAPPPTKTTSSSAKPLNSTWRQKHEDFIRSIRAAKKVQAHVAAGGSIKDLPPPPPSENPDYVQCPHCQRRFNKAAAERHIPKCADYQYNKPKPQARNAAAAANKPGPTRPTRR